MGLPSLKEQNAVTLRKISDIGHNERDLWLIYILRNEIYVESRRKWVAKSRDELKQAITLSLSFFGKERILLVSPLVSNGIHRHI